MRYRSLSELTDDDRASRARECDEQLVLLRAEWAVTPWWSLWERLTLAGAMRLVRANGAAYRGDPLGYWTWSSWV